MSQKHKIVLILGLTLCFALSFVIRSSDYENVSAARNIEASYHVLLTSRALRENPVSDHYLLSTVTLGGEANANVPWGSAVPTASGDYLYTSFTPVSFWVIYVADLITPGPLFLEGLARANSALGIVQALLLVLLAYQIAIYLKADRRTAAICVFFAVLISIFSREALQAYGVIYWAHSFYQIILVVCLLLSFALLRTRGKAPVVLKCALLFFVFFGAWTEWTGYVFGGGLAVVLLLFDRLEALKSWFPFLVAGMLVLAGMVTIGHYALAAGLTDTLKAFAERSSARSLVNSWGMGAFLKGYYLSFGMFFLPIILAIVILIFAGRKKIWHTLGTEEVRVLSSLTALATIPLLENILLLQHATQFTFDRLKFIAPAVILFVIASVFAGRLMRGTLFAMLVFSSVGGVFAYRADIASYAWFDTVDRDNRAMASQLAAVTDGSCTRYVTNTSVRGYMNLLFERSITENFVNDRTENISDILEDSEICSLVVLSAEMVETDLPKLLKATIYSPDGSAVIFALADGVVTMQ